MAIKMVPELEPLPVRTEPQQRRSGGWFTRIQRRVKLAMAGDDETLLVVNNTAISWYVYHKFHQLGVLDPGERVVFSLRKRGNLNARPGMESDAVEYLVLDLNARIQRVEIYRRSMGKDLDMYEMRAS